MLAISFPLSIIVNAIGAKKPFFCICDSFIPLLFFIFFFIVFTIQMILMRKDFQNAIYSGVVSIIILLILLILKFKKKNSNINEDDDDLFNAKKCFRYHPFNITIIHIIINTILSFLSSFSLIYLTHYDDSDRFFEIYFSFILAIAHSNLLFPKTSEFYSISFSNFENSQTRCFSILLLSIFSFLFKKYKINNNVFYLLIEGCIDVILILMIFNLSIIFGFIGLPRSTIHWFIEFVNRYSFGFSGSTTFFKCILQFVFGLISIAFNCVVLYFKNTFWSRMICLFFSSFVTSFEINKKVVLFALIKSVVGSIFFIIFNRFLCDKIACNIIEIVFIVYYFIFEFIIPYISSISCYFFVYIQFIENNKILNYIRLSVSLISAPIVVGSLLSDDVHFVISSFLITHSINRSFSEPHVFGVALIIARFLLYYDFELTSNIALNFLISLCIARKFFSIINILYMRCKISMGFGETDLSIFRMLFSDAIDFSGFKPLVQIIIYYFKGIFFIPSYCLYIPSFIWSLITGSPINFLYMLDSFSQPYPPKSNLFWDFTSEKYPTDEHIIESFVYCSYLNSFKEKIFNMIKKCELGIVDENSFFLFHQDRSIILVHIISINSFSVDFQIRCAEFTTNTLCHAGELRVFSDIQGHDLRRLNMHESVQFIKSIYSPVANDISLHGFNYYPIDIQSAYVSLTPEQKRQWITYSVCYCFAEQNNKDDSLLKLVNEGGDSLINDIKNKFESIVDSINKANEDANENTNNNNNDNDNTNNNNNDNDNTNTNNNDNESINDNENIDNNNDNENVDNNENSSNSEDTSENINNNHADDDSVMLEEVEAQNSDNSDNDNNNDEIPNYFNDYPLDEEIYRKFEFNSQNVHDFLYNSYDIINYFMKRPTSFFRDSLIQFQETVVESFLINAGMRSCLYMFLASSYLAPEPDDFDEVGEFLDQTEEEYLILNNSELQKSLIEFRNQKNNVFANRCLFSIMKSDKNNKLTFIRESECKWNVFKIDRDFLRSIWASQSCEILGFKNMTNERFSNQKNIYHLHNLLNQISDIPMSYPAYVSNIEKSYIVENNL